MLVVKWKTKKLAGSVGQLKELLAVKTTASEPTRQTTEVAILSYSNRVVVTGQEVGR